MTSENSMKPSGSTETNPRFGASTPKSAKVIGMLPATCPAVGVEHGLELDGRPTG